jgi:hypothetical protein
MRSVATAVAAAAENFNVVYEIFFGQGFNNV